MLRAQKSIFLKLLLVFALAAAANVGIMQIFQRHIVSSDVRRLHRLQNIGEYAKLTLASLGPRPSLSQMQALSERLHLKLRIEGPGFQRVSSPDVPDFKTVRARVSPRYADKDLTLGRYRDFLAIETSVGDTHYLVFLESENAIEDHSELILGLMLALLFILLTTYLMIRKILSPIRSLEKGVHELTQGNLEVCIPLESQDELGSLVRSFNTMASQVRGMVQSKEQLLLDVSHEIRSPLSRIKVAVELPGNDAKDSIRRSVRELEAMISELLETARLNDAQGRLKLETTDLSHLVEELVFKYKDEKPGVRFETPLDPVVSEIDLPRMRTALKNIIENGMKYSAHQNRPVEISLGHSSNELVQIQVKDFGIGIPTEDQAFIFEPFYRVDRSRVKTTGGYGLGLSLSKKIIEAHRGRVEVISEPGRETTFHIELCSS